MPTITTQRTYFSSWFADIPAISQQNLQDFLAQWIADTNEKELERIEAFVTDKRRYHKFKEGNFFRFLIDRTYYGYGRILLDTHKIKYVEMFWRKQFPFQKSVYAKKQLEL